MRHTAVQWLTALVAVGLLASPSAARDGGVCVAPGNPDDVQTSTVDEIVVQWPAAAARRGLELPLVRAATPAFCPRDTTLRVLVSSDEAHVVARDGTAFARGFRSAESAWDRARVAVQAALETLEAGRVELAVFEVADPAPPTPPARWGVLLGGVWTVQPSPGFHRGLMDVGVQAALLDEHLLLGLRAGWMPTQPIGGAPLDTTWSQLDLALTVHGALRFGDFRLRAGFGGGASAGWLEARTVTRASAVSAHEWRALLLTEAELEWGGWRGLRLAVAVGGRFEPGATAYTWRGEPLLRSASAAATAALRVGWWFN